jgi:hypothetical protein
MSAPAPLEQLLEDAGHLLREPLDFGSPKTWADVRNARAKLAEAYKLVISRRQSSEQRQDSKENK